MLGFKDDVGFMGMGEDCGFIFYFSLVAGFTWVGVPFGGLSCSILVSRHFWVVWFS